MQESDLKFLTLKDKVVQDAVASIQSLDLQADLLSHRHHDRAIQFDGDVGPATRELLTKSRCGCADYRRDDEATGSGPWPVPGCDPTRKNQAAEHSIRINVNTAGMPYSIDYWKSFISRTRACSAEFGLSARYILDGDSKQSEISVTFASLAEDEGTDLPQDMVIGRNYFPQRGTCNQTLSGWITKRWNPSSIILHSTLWCHEQLGHGIGLEHTRGGILNPSILPIDPLTWDGDPHESRMRDWYGGVTIPVDDGDSPTVPIPKPPKDSPTGFTYVDGQLYNVRVWK